MIRRSSCNEHNPSQSFRDRRTDACYIAVKVLNESFKDSWLFCHLGSHQRFGHDKPSLPISVRLLRELQ
jgi:hypothetical protein